ncbi:hypothetical protein [Inconstantimicrobium mannanitabidum]|uniref:Uncharacterized protein n=1 Tax=Inconstantimicrobium mannanitabidum TaxID=1604901 RepID=A0ACB5R9N5_9CLOT|nr:hypothetical protein [Clostridium sp. TW13]GKX65815.1 hypothetical protein rsdtw13_10730 [Clostridium sp. TW13]
MNNDKGIKIQIVEGAELLKSNLEGRIPEIGYKGVFAKSMLFDHMVNLGALDINKTKTRNVVGVTFSYGYDSLEADDRVKNIKNIKKDIKKGNSNINKLEKEIENAKNKIDENDDEITLLELELEELKELETDESKISEKEFKSIENKINTKIIKIGNLRKRIDSYIYDIAINDYCLKFEECTKEKELLDIKDHIKQTDEVRKYLYKNGFKIDYYKYDEKAGEYTDEIEETIWYDFGFRSPSKSRVGDVIFFNREYRDIINKWMMMDLELEVDKDGNVKLVEAEAYKSLVSSHIEGYVYIDPKSILVLNDLNSYGFEENLIMVDTDENNDVVAEVKRGIDKNTLWDGMCCIDESLLGEYKNKGMVVLRHLFFKSCACNTKLVKFLNDHYKENYNTAYIMDKYGRNVKVSDIRVLTTENSIKWEKLMSKDATSYDYWCSKVEENHCMFGICKTTHESKYKVGETIKNRMSYQFTNSFADMSKEEIQELCKDSIDYIMKLKNDDDFFVNHLLRNKSKVNNYEMLAKIYKQNKLFSKSHMFKEVRRKLINKYKETLYNGKLLVEGDNLTVFANIWTILQYAVGLVPYHIVEHDDGSKEYIIDDNYRDETLPVLLNETGDSNNGYSCYAKLFKDKQEICAMRSPHNAPNAIMYYINHKHHLIDDYFNLDNNIIVVNCIKNSLQSAGMGWDEDSDFFFCTVNNIAIEASKKAQKYPTIVNKIEPSKKKYKNTMECLAEVDNLLAKSKRQIGSTSNNAQLALTYYHHIKELYRGTNVGKERIESLLNNVAINAIMAQICIDQSKKIFPIDIEKQIDRLKKELPCDLKPTFWQYTTSITDPEEVEKKLRKKNKVEWDKLKDKEKKERVKAKIKEIKENLIELDCPMDWIIPEINSIKNADKSKQISDSNFLVYYVDKTKSRQTSRKAKEVEKIVEEFNTITNFINANDDFDDEDNILYYNTLYKEYMDKLKDLNINIYVESLLIARALDKDNKYLKSNSYMKTKLLNILYNNNPKRFLSCFKNTKELEEINSLS